MNHYRTSEARFFLGTKKLGFVVNNFRPKTIG
jgi:hypothetical protein